MNRLFGLNTPFERFDKIINTISMPSIIVDQPIFCFCATCHAFVNAVLRFQIETGKNLSAVLSEERKQVRGNF